MTIDANTVGFMRAWLDVCWATLSSVCVCVCVCPHIPAHTWYEHVCTYRGTYNKNWYIKNICKNATHMQLITHICDWYWAGVRESENPFQDVARGTGMNIRNTQNACGRRRMSLGDIEALWET